MSRIIINNRSSASDINAIEMVQKVIEGGRISNDGKQYCYLTVFNSADGKDSYKVTFDLRKSSDSFTVTDDNGKGI